MREEGMSGEDGESGRQQGGCKESSIRMRRWLCSGVKDDTGEDSER